MSRTDLVSDAFTIIRNAIKVKKEDVVIPYSNFLLKICEIVKREGYIDNFKEVESENFKKIKIYLKYERKKSVLKEIRKVSTPGRKVYIKKDQIPLILRGYGLAILSTSQGILTDREANAKGVGGEYIGVIW